MWLQAKRYVGDGSLGICSTLFSSGYFITFSRFRANKPYSASYRLFHVPQTRAVFLLGDPYVELCFFWDAGFVDRDWVKSHTTASFKLTVTKVPGQVIRVLEFPLSTLWWGESQNFHELWRDKDGTLHFDRNADYIIHLDYFPGTNPPPTAELFLRLKDCPSY